MTDIQDNHEDDDNIDLNEIETNKIINYLDYPKLHSLISSKYIFWSRYLFSTNDIYNDSCINCKLFYLKFSNKIVCSRCNVNIKAEMDEFDKFISDNYPILNEYNGIYSRIKLIMFTHRNELLSKKCNPVAINFYKSRLNLSDYNCDKILRITQDCKRESYYCNSYSNDNYFYYIMNGSGASDKKLKITIKKGKLICPIIFNQEHYTSLLDRIIWKQKQKQNKQ